MEWHQENQGKLGSMAEGYPCTAFGKLCLITANNASSRQRLHKCVTNGKSLKCNIGLSNNYAGKNPNDIHALRESSFLSKHEQAVIGIKYCESDESGKTANRKPLLICQQMHMGGKSFECNSCGKAFSSKSNFVVHQETHEEAKPYKCDGCGKDSSNKSYLVAHQRTHKGEQLHECSDLKTFSFNSQLVLHQRIHTQENPYECCECGKVFTRRDQLVSHQRTHSGLKPYGCHECGKAFGLKSQLII